MGHLGVAHVSFDGGLVLNGAAHNAVDLLHATGAHHESHVCEVRVVSEESLHIKLVLSIELNSAPLLSGTVLDESCRVAVVDLLSVSLEVIGIALLSGSVKIAFIHEGKISRNYIRLENNKHNILQLP